MNSYAYDEISVGHEERFRTAITPEHMRMFREISGDDNPLHNDGEYARANGYPDRVAFGMLTASFLSTLAGVYLPGENCLIHEIDVKFVKPVVIYGCKNNNGGGYLVDVVGTVTEKHDLFRRLTVKARIKNESGEDVLRATMKVGVRA
jgi:acyl dehydratase